MCLSVYGCVCACAVVRVCVVGGCRTTYATLDVDNRSVTRSFFIYPGLIQLCNNNYQSTTEQHQRMYTQTKN